MTIKFIGEDVKDLLKLYIIVVLMLTGCSAEQDISDAPLQQTNNMPVLFSAGNLETVVTRATSAAYMSDASQFVCTMFIHGGANDTNDSEYALPLADVNMFSNTLTIEGGHGNARYADDRTFYWQNRLNHVFLALADNNYLTEAPSVVIGEKKEYDLTRGNKSSMAEQNDPMLAHVIMCPTGATAEANRVKLFFQHQFAQVLINLKSSQDGSAIVDETLIERVELLGVAEKAYVSYSITSDGSIPAASSEPINIDDTKYDATRKDNPYGSSFDMFVCPTATAGYQKSFEAIAFGTLQGIRITWKESNEADAIKHITTFKGVKNQTLKSGYKYIYNMELRRSLIAQVTTEILPWNMDTTTYDADATIENRD